MTIRMALHAVSLRHTYTVSHSINSVILSAAKNLATNTRIHAEILRFAQNDNIDVLKWNK